MSRWSVPRGRLLAAARSAVALGALVLSAGAVTAQEGAATPDSDRDLLQRVADLERRLSEQEQENARLEQKVDALQERDMERERARASGAAPSPGPAPGGVDEDPGPVRGLALRQQRRLGTMGGMYAKPFLLEAGGAHVGGYIDLEYRDGQGSDRRFVQHRFIPFIFSEITETLRFAAELEFEYGGTDFSRGDGEVKVEYAAMDWELDEAFGVRAGAILVPLGKFNLVHDSPVNDLTDRPLVDRVIIPTTMTEAGIGAFGTFYPGGEWEISYEAYLTNGFVGLEEDSDAPTGYRSNITRSGGVRGARPGMKLDNNNSVACTGRIALSPTLGAELGTSWHVGRYDDKGDNYMGIYALDLTLQAVRFFDALAGLELQAELAWADISRNRLARRSGVPDDLWGFYAQLNYHFMFDILREAAPVAFGEESTFTAVVRLDHTDLDGVKDERFTIGLNFRPVEDTVFKVEYQFDLEDWSHTRDEDDTFVFSVATYF
jgi:hypothetical protein